MEVLDLPYLQSTRREMLKKRARWLTILLIGEMRPRPHWASSSTSSTRRSSCRSSSADHLERRQLRFAGLDLVIRAMALGEVRIADWLRVFRREILMGLMLGTILGSIAALRVTIWAPPAPTRVRRRALHPHGLTVAVSLIGCVLWAR